MKVLLAVDDSAHSEMAVREVETRTWPEGTTVRVLSAVEKIVVPSGDIWSSVDQKAWETDSKRAAQTVASVAQRLRSSDLAVEIAVREGQPHKVIVEEAKGWPADIIVVGSEGRRGLKRLLRHSVSRAVVNRAPCNVEVVTRRRQRN